MRQADPIPLQPLRFLALGDSYTIGEGVPAPARWPMQLAQRLRAERIAILDPDIVATTGWTTDELAAAMDASELSPSYALVTLLIGVNNQYRGRDLDNYRDEFSALLERAIGLAGDRADRTLVVSIPDWGVTRFAAEQGRDSARIAAEIDAFNAAARTVSTHRHVTFVDVTTASRAAGAEVGMLVDDGLHPSAVQYALWTDAIFAVALRLGLAAGVDAGRVSAA